MNKNFVCPICQKNFLSYDADKRNSHVNRCIDESQLSQASSRDEINPPKLKQTKLKLQKDDLDLSLAIALSSKQPKNKKKDVGNNNLQFGSVKHKRRRVKITEDSHLLSPDEVDGFVLDSKRIENVLGPTLDFNNMDIEESDNGDFLDKESSDNDDVIETSLWELHEGKSSSSFCLDIVNNVSTTLEKDGMFSKIEQIHLSHRDSVKLLEEILSNQITLLKQDFDKDVLELEKERNEKIDLFLRESRNQSTEKGDNIKNGVLSNAVLDTRNCILGDVLDSKIIEDVDIIPKSPPLLSSRFFSKLSKEPFVEKSLSINIDDGNKKYPKSRKLSFEEKNSVTSDAENESLFIARAVEKGCLSNDEEVSCFTKSSPSKEVNADVLDSFNINHTFSSNKDYNPNSKDIDSKITQILNSTFSSFDVFQVDDQYDYSSNPTDKNSSEKIILKIDYYNNSFDAYNNYDDDINYDHVNYDYDENYHYQSSFSSPLKTKNLNLKNDLDDSIIIIDNNRKVLQQNSLKKIVKSSTPAITKQAAVVSKKSKIIDTTDKLENIDIYDKNANLEKLSLAMLKSLALKHGITGKTKKVLIENLKKLRNGEDEGLDEESLDVDQKLLRFFQNNTKLLTKILLFEPLNVKEVVKEFNGGIKCSKKLLTCFLDSQSITYYMDEDK